MNWFGQSERITDLLPHTPATDLLSWTISSWITMQRVGVCHVKTTIWIKLDKESLRICAFDCAWLWLKYMNIFYPVTLRVSSHWSHRHGDQHHHKLSVLNTGFVFTSVKTVQPQIWNFTAELNVHFTSVSKQTGLLYLFVLFHEIKFRVMTSLNVGGWQSRSKYGPTSNAYMVMDF